MAKNSQGCLCILIHTFLLFCFRLLVLFLFIILYLVAINGVASVIRLNFLTRIASVAFVSYFFYFLSLLSTKYKLP